MKKNHLGQKLGYACGDIYGGGSFLIFSMLYMGFLILVEGLSPVQTATIMFIGKLWDAVTDPVMGLLSDRTHTRFGRRRVYFLFGSAVVLASFVMLWSSFGIEGARQLVLYHTLAYMFFGTAFTIVMVPYNAILSDITDDYNERTSYTGTRMVFSAATALICAVVPALIISRAGSAQVGPAQKAGYLVMGVVFGVFFAVAWLVTFFATKEKPELQNRTQPAGLREWGVVIKNKSYLIYLGIFLTVQIAIDLLLALTVFYVDIVLMKSESYTVIVGVLAVFQLIFMFPVNLIAQKKGKHFPLLVALPVWIAVSFVYLFFSPSTPLWMVCVASGIIAFGAAAGNLCTWSMLSDTFEVDELITANRHEGVYSGFTTFMRKAASGIAILILGFGLEAAGFDQNEYNVLKAVDSASGSFNAAAYATSGTVSAIRILFVVVPVVLLTVTIILALRYRLDKRRFDLVMSSIGRFKAEGAAATFTQEEQKDLELVTGQPADSLWNGVLGGGARSEKGGG